jgi:hypothetical protein
VVSAKARWTPYKSYWKRTGAAGYYNSTILSKCKYSTPSGLWRILPVSYSLFVLKPFGLSFQIIVPILLPSTSLSQRLYLSIPNHCSDLLNPRHLCSIYYFNLTDLRHLHSISSLSIKATDYSKHLL